MSAENTEASDGLVEHVYNGKTIRIYPEVAEFFAAMDGSRRELDLAYAKADAVWYTAMYADKIEYLENGGNPDTYEERSRNPKAWQVKTDARRVAEHKYFDLIEANRMDPAQRRDVSNPNAWADLRAKTTHKEVQWILDNTILAEPSASRTMLHYLPNPPEKIWEYGKDDHRFCAVFDQFYAQAEAAGLFSEADVLGMAGMKEFRALQSYVRRELYSDTATRVNRDVSKIMTVMREAFAKQLAEAKAEWQGLDEARRSEGARKAAVTRAANRAAQESMAEDLAEAETQIKDLLKQEIPQPHAAAQAAAKTDDDCVTCNMKPDVIHVHADPSMDTEASIFA